MTKNIVLIQFSSREDGNSTKIQRYITKYYNNTNVTSIAISSQNLSTCGNCDYECLKVGEVCPHRNRFLVETMDAIISSDIAYFIIPNYCGFPCANYYAFNERSVGYFNMDRKLLEKYMQVQKHSSLSVSPKVRAS